MKTGGNTSLSVDTALGRDVTRAPVTIIPVLPLADAGWTLGSGVNTLVGIIVTTYIPTSTPGAVTASVQIQISAIFVITVLVDWRPLVLLSSGLIAAKIGWPLLSCSGGGKCDGAGTF